MINSIVMSNLLKLDISDVKKLYIARVLNDRKSNEAIYEWLSENGFVELSSNEEIINAGDAEYTKDGRTVVRFASKIYAISAEEYKNYLNNNFVKEKKIKDNTEIKYCGVVIDKEQQLVCGGELIFENLCGKSNYGKLGYSKKSTCTVCGTVEVYE